MALLAFLVYDAKSMGECGIIFFFSIGVAEGLAAYFITLWKMDDILLFIKNCEEFIAKSKH